MAKLFQFLGRILRLILGEPRPTGPDPIAPTQPSLSQPAPEDMSVPNVAPVAPAAPLQSAPAAPTPSVPSAAIPSAAVPPLPAELLGIDIPGLPPERTKRLWTLMIFMAGDNGLKFETEAGLEQIMAEMTSAGYKDIVELRAAGTSEQVACVVQFDTMSESDRSYRIIINPPGQAPTVHNIPETNTGDPVTLQEFIVWGQQTFPAQHYAVIVWNHGGGWKEDDLWARYRDALPPATRGEDARSLFSDRKIRKALFLRTSDRIMSLPDEPPPTSTRSTRRASARVQTRRIVDRPTSDDDATDSDIPLLDRLEAMAQNEDEDEPSSRWIAADDSSKDFLDNAELQAAFRQAAIHTGETVDIIGMDACLMAMVEVAFQLRQNATFLVASQELEPMAGWDYTRLLRALVGQPDLRPEQVAEAMVDLYMASYDNDGQRAITQSATILGQMDALAELLNRFVGAVERHWESNPDLAVRLQRAKSGALSFDDPDYRDLVDFLRLVVWEMDSMTGASSAGAGENAGDGEAGDVERGIDTSASADVRRAAEAILKVVDDPQRSPVLTKGVAGVQYQQPGTGEYRAHGLAIYLPRQHISQFYDGLDFRVSRWGDLIRLMNGIAG